MRATICVKHSFQTLRTILNRLSRSNTISSMLKSAQPISEKLQRLIIVVLASNSSSCCGRNVARQQFRNLSACQPQDSASPKTSLFSVSHNLHNVPIPSPRPAPLHARLPRPSAAAHPTLSSRRNPSPTASNPAATTARRILQRKIHKTAAQLRQGTSARKARPVSTALTPAAPRQKGAHTQLWRGSYGRGTGCAEEEAVSEHDAAGGDVHVLVPDEPDDTFLDRDGEEEPVTARSGCARFADSLMCLDCTLGMWAGVNRAEF